MLNFNRQILLFLILLTSSNSVLSYELSTDLQLEFRLFNEKGQMEQEQFQGSIALEPSYEILLNSDKDIINIQLFGRYDELDKERTHFDIRELSWLKIFKNFELKLGISKVFWGVTESAHLVDIINQTDFVEDFDGEEKLGQPLISLTVPSSFGVFEAYILPYFRERTFSGSKGRLGFPFPIADPIYESDNEEKHIDGAFRWSHTIDKFDVGLTYFKGTSRDPQLILLANNIIPIYDQIDQYGLDLQATFSSLLIKLEAIHRTWSPEDYYAYVVGQEYTFNGIFSSSYDLGLLTEYHYDDRKELALTPFENDLFVGFRLAFNDVDDSQLLAGITFDFRKIY